MSRLTGWWDRRSGPARVELYTRWSFHLVVLLEVIEVGGFALSAHASAALRAALCTLVVVHAALCAALFSRGLDWYLGRRVRPVGLLRAVAALSAGTAIATPLLRANGSLLDVGDATAFLIGITCFGLGAMYLGLRHPRVTLYCVVGTAVLTAAAAALAGRPGREAIGPALVVLVAGAAASFAVGCSAWLLGAVWDLDAARDAQARLAVAEERLRFGRDLHDVMGRNLAVIALKSELAVQLSRRGRPEAAEQMIEVQRIARESQREVSEVVRGYRKADMAVELAGALSVLRAAGVEGRAEVDDDAGGLPPGVQAVLGWVLREATTNVLRHSEAGHCTIRLAVGASAVLSVENDGVSDRPGGPSGLGAGSGLAGLRDRLIASGGTLAAEPSRDGVFRLTADIPLPQAATSRRRRTAAAVPALDAEGVTG